MAFIKNQAVTGFTFGLVSKTDGSDITTGTPVGRVTIDGGTQAAIADTTFVHEGSGQWSVDLTAAEMNGDIISLVFTHTSAVSAHFTIKTDDLVESDGGSPAENRFKKKALELSPASGGGGKESGTWRFSNNTAATDPGTGGIKVNNTTYASITQVYIHQITQNGGNGAFAIEALKIGDTIVIAQANDTGNIIVVKTTALPVDNGAWYTIAVSFSSSSGVVQNNRDAIVELRYVGVTTDQIADAVWRFVLSGITAAGSGSKVVSDMKVDTAAILIDTADMQPKLGAPAGASVSVDIAAIKTETALIVADTNELQTDDIPGKIAALNDIAATEIVSAGAITTLSGAIVNVDTVDTCTVNTDMRGTNSAALASVATEARLAELDAANLPANIDNILTDTGTTLDGKINGIQGGGFNTATDSLEAIRDRGDSAWVTGGGGGGSDRFLLIDTTIATLASQTVFTLTAGSGDDGAYDNCTIIVEDVATVVQKARGVVIGYVGGTRQVTLKEALVFNIAATDKVYIVAENSLKSTVSNRQLDVTVNGNAGIDWGNVENKSTANDLSATDIQLCDTVTVNTDMRGTNSANTVVPDNTSIAAILVDTNELQTDWTDGGRLDLLIDRLITQIDTAITEPGSGTPPVSAKMADKIGYLYKSLINKSDQTATTNQLYNSNSTTVGQQRTVNFTSGVATKEKLVTG